jgi:nucleoid-associated protein YgaU
LAALVVWSSLRELEPRAPARADLTRDSAPPRVLPDVSAPPAATRAPQATVSASATDATYEPATDAAAREHVVTEGETLAQIASRYYGDPGRANDVYAANRDRIRDPAQLHEGQTLVIP